MRRIESSSDPLPYTQLDRAVFPIAAALGDVIGVSRQHAIGSLIDFWGLNGDPRTLEKLLLEGVEEVVRSADEIRRLFRLASGGKELQPEALVDLGLLEKRGEDQFRVRGMSRFFEPIKARLAARERASVAGKASAASRLAVRGSAQPEFDGRSTSPEHPPNIHPNIDPTPPKQRTAVSGQRSADSGQRAAVSGQNISAGEKPPADPKPPRKLPKPADSRHAPMVAALVEAYREETMGATYAVGGRDAKCVQELLARAADDEEILFRWRTALRLSLDKFHSPKTRTFADLLRDWNAYPCVPAATAPPREMRL